MYLDGEMIASLASGGDMDNLPKYLLLNFAVFPANGAPWNNAPPAPDAASRATMPWTSYIDWVQVLQFG